MKINDKEAATAYQSKSLKRRQILKRIPVTVVVTIETTKKRTTPNLNVIGILDIPFALTLALYSIILSSQRPGAATTGMRRRMHRITRGQNMIRITSLYSNVVAVYFEFYLMSSFAPPTLAKTSNKP